MQAIFQKKSSRSRTHQTGLTLVELSIALAISAVVVMSALIGIRKLIDSNNSRAALTQMGSALANMSKTAQSLNDYSVYDDTLGMAKMGVFDSGALVKTSNAISQVRNSFGGYVWTRRNSAATDTLAANNGLWYVITGVPNSACTDVVSGSNNTAIAIYVTATGAAPLANPLVQYTGGTPANVTSNATPKLSGGVMNPNNIEASCGAAASSLKDIYILTTI